MTIYKQGKYWYLNYRKDGKQIRKSLKTTQKSIAEELARRIMTEIALGITPTPDVSFAEFTKEFFDMIRADKSPTTLKRYEVSLNSLLSHFGALTLREIDYKTIQAYKQKRLVKVGPATVNRDLACLRYMLNIGIKCKYLEKNPVNEVEFLKEPEPRDRVLSFSELKRILDFGDSTMNAIVLIAVNTGIRLGDILALTPGDANIADKTLRVFDRKTHKTRVIPLNEIAYRELAKRCDGSANKPFFSYTVNQISKRFHKIAKKAGLVDVTFHDLRRTFLTKIVDLKYSLKTAATLSGHRTLRALERYTHPDQDHLRQAVEELALIEEAQQA